VYGEILVVRYYCSGVSSSLSRRAERKRRGYANNEIKITVVEIIARTVLDRLIRFVFIVTFPVGSIIFLSYAYTYFVTNRDSGGVGGVPGDSVRFCPPNVLS